jgi:hypothetical protein
MSAITKTVFSPFILGKIIRVFASFSLAGSVVRFLSILIYQCCTVMYIRGILLPIRICTTDLQIRILLFLSGTFKVTTKNNFFSKLFCFLPVLFECTFTPFFKEKVIKKSQKSRNQDFSYHFLLDDGRIWIWEVQKLTDLQHWYYTYSHQNGNRCGSTLHIRPVCVKVQADRIAQLRQLAREQVDLEKRKMALLSKLQSEVQK